MGGSSGEIAISVRGLYKSFGGDASLAMEMAESGASKVDIQESTGSVAAISDVSFDVAAGELFVVMGLSGCGKSTLVRCINRLIEVDRGEVWVKGVEITAMDNDELIDLRRNQLAMVFQHYGLLPHRNVFDNVAWGMELSGVERTEKDDRAAEALSAVGLKGWERNFPGELSGGMKQRVGLARALAQNSPVMLMDEPFSALDPLIRRDLQGELMQMQEEFRKTIVFITHDMNEAVRLGDRVAIMREGRFVQVGTPEDVVLDPVDDFVRDFTRDVRQHSMLTAESIMGDALHIFNGGSMASQALDAIIDGDQSYTLVVDDAGRYIGTANVQRISRAVRGGDAKLGEIPLLFDATVNRDTVLDDLVPTGLRCNHSVPVLDDGGTLVGEVSLDVLADAMGSDSGTNA